MRICVLFFIVMSIVFAGEKISDQDGRYEYSQLGDARKDQFMVDTQTGKTWVTYYTDDNIAILVPVYYYGGGLKPDAAGVKETNGRYKMGQISQARADQFMLDTKTGRMWNVVEDKNENYTLRPVFYKDGGFLPN